LIGAELDELTEHDTRAVQGERITAAVDAGVRAFLRATAVA
jgi:hypothetical protein